MHRPIMLAALCGCAPAVVDATDSDEGDGVSAPETDVWVGDTAPFSVLDIVLVDPPFFLEVGDEVSLDGRVRGTRDPSMSVLSSLDGGLPAPSLGADGSFSIPLDTLSPGHHTVTLTATDPTDGVAVEEVLLGVCTWPEIETFDAGTPPGWTLSGDAYWDPGGWLEVTGNTGSRSGHIYLTDRVVRPGDFSVAFDFATGDGANTGADGYAVNIVAVPTLADLDAYIGATSNGGCLGYGSDSVCGSHEVTALHIELDTWYNGEYSDPTSLNHIAIARDGDPSNILLWHAMPFEDLTWRRVEVRGEGTLLSILVDGTEVASKDIPDFRFEGGFLGVSGSTGYAYNYHRLDNLEVRDRCEVPSSP